MFEYNICNMPDEEIFTRQCSALEKHIPNIFKKELLEDVDGSKTQLYKIGINNVSVHNSEYIGAVFIKSDIDLTPYFKYGKY